MIRVYKLKSIIKMISFIIIISLTLLVLGIKFNKEEAIATYYKNDSYKIFVDVEDSKLFLFKNEELIKIYKCSGGKWSTPSPIGTWTIIYKAKWGEGFGRKLASD